MAAVLLPLPVAVLAQCAPAGAGWGSNTEAWEAVVAGTADLSSDHYCEGAAALQLGAGFFRPESRPSRDLGVLLAALLARGELGLSQPLSVLDLMAGCGIRALRYGLEAGAAAVWANDADTDRLPVLQNNLAPLSAAGSAPEITAHTAQKLLAGCLLDERRFGLLDLDAFGCPTPLVPASLEALQFEGVLYLASTDGRSPTGHDRAAAVRSLGAAARAHPASWELALRLQIAVVARAAWAMGRGIRPLFSFSEGRTFRTAIQLQRRADPRQERQLGLLAHCHACGEQLEQSLLQLRQWPACACTVDPPPLAISGPLWLGPLQHAPTLAAMQQEAQRLPSGSVGAHRALVGALARGSRRARPLLAQCGAGAAPRWRPAGNPGVAGGPGR
ncbi:N2,N2-dimethylguanosine tRNA methyltransferase [Synechococcus sp. CB0101]|uniref:N2,N2-dimethylguanosine tRNA methyltransferase n=1 Tax=Synechococcus sp. CB0101 TaxID=232348 RepID=UPI0026858EAE